MSVFSLAGMNAQGRADKVTETYAREMANEAGARAPVDTGDWRANRIASPNRVKAGTWEFGGTLPYTRRQEDEHHSKKGLIRKPVRGNRNDYRHALKRGATKVWIYD